MKKKAIAIATSVVLLGAGLYFLLKPKGKKEMQPSTTPPTPPNTSTPPSSTNVQLSDVTSNTNVYLSKTNTRLRSTPTTSVDTNISYVYRTLGVELQASKQGRSTDGYIWYFVKDSSGRSGYVRQDVVTQKISGAPTPENTLTDVKMNFFTYLTKNNTRLRSTPNTSSLDNVVTVYRNANEELKANKQGKSTDGYVWYLVTDASGRNGYVREDAVVMKSTAGGTTTIPTTTPTVSKVKTKKGTRLRSSMSTASDSNIDYTYQTVGQVLNVLSETSVAPYKWYEVTDTSGRKGYVRNDAVTV